MSLLALKERQEADELDLLIDESARALAGADVPHDLEARLKMRSLMMHTAAPSPNVAAAALPSAPPARVILFGSLDRSRVSVRDQRSFFGAALLHAAALALIAIGVHAATRTPVMTKQVEVSLVLPPPVTPPAPAKNTASDGGGGHAGRSPVVQGTPPRSAPVQLVPLEQPRVVQPALAAEPTVNVQTDLKMEQTDVTHFGVANSPAVGTSLGNGHGRGIGDGDGDGIGPGHGSNTGGGALRRIGGGVQAPIVIFAPEAEFSEEARKAKVGGNVIVYLEVDTAGRPAHVRVLRGIGMGLDEKAIAAVKLYRFKPALEAGQPVPVEMTVEVNFAIF